MGMRLLSGVGAEVGNKGSDEKRRLDDLSLVSHLDFTLISGLVLVAVLASTKFAGFTQQWYRAVELVHCSEVTTAAFTIQNCYFQK